ncbi:MAG: entericidin [Candidatus Omnitrophica bacterium]|nr:entericidin [Candidatus Omnitrophota bacterium]
MKRIGSIFLGVLFVISLYGCNTIKGVGKDLSAVGGWITDGAGHVEESIKNNPPNSAK